MCWWKVKDAERQIHAAVSRRVPPVPHLTSSRLREPEASRLTRISSHSLSLRWIFMCLPRFPLYLKLFSQSWQLKGRSPVWLLMCSFRCERRTKHFPQTEQLFLASPEWILMCPFRYDLQTNVRLHSGQINVSFSFWSVWILLCLLHEKLLLQTRPCVFSPHVETLSGKLNGFWPSSEPRSLRWIQPQTQNKVKLSHPVLDLSSQLVLTLHSQLLSPHVVVQSCWLEARLDSGEVVWTHWQTCGFSAGETTWRFDHSWTVSAPCDEPDAASG